MESSRKHEMEKARREKGKQIRTGGQNLLLRVFVLSCSRACLRAGTSDARLYAFSGQKRRPSTAMPWRCTSESPLPQSGHLGPGCVIRVRPARARRKAAVHAAGAFMVRCPTGKVSAPQNGRIDSTSMIEDHTRARYRRPKRDGTSHSTSSYRFARTTTRKVTWPGLRGRRRSRHSVTQPRESPVLWGGRAEGMSPPGSKQPRQLVIDHLPGGTFPSLARPAQLPCLGRRPFGHRGGIRNMVPRTNIPNTQCAMVKTHSGTS